MANTVLAQLKICRLVVKFLPVVPGPPEPIQRGRDAEISDSGADFPRSACLPACHLQ